MAKINKQEIIQKLIDELNLYPGKDTIPTELAEKILAVYQINTQDITVKTPSASVVRTDTHTMDGTTTMYTTPATGKFYLTNVAISGTQNPAAAANGNLYVTITIDGAAQEVAYVQMAVPAQGVGHSNICLNLQNPVLVDPGTNITFTTSHLSFDGAATIIGYTTD